MTLAKALCPGWHAEKAVEHLRQHVFAGSVPLSIPSGGLWRHSVVEHGMGWSRRLRGAKSPSTARDDDGVSSSTALAVFAGRGSSSMGWRRLSLLCVVQYRREACLTTRCRRARFFVAYDNTVQYRYNICSNLHYNKP